VPDTFRALRAHKTEAGIEARLETLTDADLMEADVTVRVEASTINFKDGLALTGRSPILRAFPLIPGIDFAGVVEASSNPGFAAGDRVVLNGWGVGETWHGGYAQKARVKGDWLVRLPDSLSTARAMAIGTAGYTAMLCVMTLERQGVTPGSGDILVTGAAGGVGSVSIALLSALGYRVVASSRRAESEGDYLRNLGAAEVIDAAEFSGPARPVGKERWAGVVDSVGSHTLANALSQTRYGGAVAACGLAQGMDLPGSVAPFILRSVVLAGVDSVMRPMPDRIRDPRREGPWPGGDRSLDLAGPGGGPPGGQQQKPGEDSQVLDEVLHLVLAVAAGIVVPEVVHEQVDQQGHSGEQERGCPGVPVRHQRQSAADLQGNGQQKHGQGERHFMELHIGHSTGEPGDLHQAGNHEVEPEQDAPGQVHRPAEPVEQGVQGIVHENSGVKNVGVQDALSL